MSNAQLSADRKRIWRKRFFGWPRRRIRDLLRWFRRAFRPAEMGAVEKRLAHLEAGQSRLFHALYADQMPPADPRTELRRREFRALTESGEAGILHYLFSKIGVTDRRCIEFGIGAPEKCNISDLVISFGWHGMLIDGSEESAEQARGFFAERGRHTTGTMKVVCAWLEPDSVDRVFRENGFEGEIDLLSIDVDGVDYWIWKAIEGVRPRVLMLEYNASLGPEAAVTVPYAPGFDSYARHPFGWHHGASLVAMERLARRKGYALVGCESMGHNAFFVRADLAEGKLAVLTAAQAWYPDGYRSKDVSPEGQADSLKGLPWENVDP